MPQQMRTLAKLEFLWVFIRRNNIFNKQYLYLIMCNFLDCCAARTQRLPSANAMLKSNSVAQLG